MFKLYDGGIHNDTSAIQEMIDSGTDEVLINTGSIETLDP